MTIFWIASHLRKFHHSARLRRLDGSCEHEQERGS